MVREAPLPFPGSRPHVASVLAELGQGASVGHRCPALPASQSSSRPWRKGPGQEPFTNLCLVLDLPGGTWDLGAVSVTLLKVRVSEEPS